jgi:hypothetical protein
MRHVNLTDEHQEEAWIAGQKIRIHNKLVALLNGHGRPPEDDDLGMNIHLGRLAITYKQAKHIWDERMEAHRLDPAGHPHPSKVLGDIAEAAVIGTPTFDPTMSEDLKGSKPPKDSKDRIWLTHGQHLVSVAPLWDAPGGEKKGTTTRCWIVTGYQMDALRFQQAHKAKKDHPIPTPKDKVR